MTRATLARLGALLLTASLAAGCSGDGSEKSATPDSTSYGTETLMPAVAKAVAEQEHVHLGLGDQRGRPDISMNLSWADPPQFRALAGDRPGELLEVLLVNDRVYVGGEAAESTWTYLPLDDPRVEGKDPDFDSGIVPVLVDVDVPAEFAALVDAVTKVANEGEEEMNGLASTHYVVTIEPQAWQDALPENSMHRQMELDEPAVLDLWIDESSLPVRWEYAGTGGRLDTARVDFSNWGTPIAVVEPKNAEPAGSSAS